MTILELAQVLAHHIQDVKIEFINKKPVIVITRTYNEDSNKYAIAFSKICCRAGDMLFCFDEDEDRPIISGYIGKYLGYDIWFNGFYGSEM